MPVIKVIATETISSKDRVFCDQGFVRIAHVGADRNSGIAFEPLNKGEVGNYNTDTRELRRAPKRRG